MAPITWLRADLRIEDAAGCAHREHAAHADLAGGGIDADFDEMRAEGRLLVLLVEVAELDRVLGDEAAFARRLGERHAAVARRDLAVGEHRVGGVEAELLRHGLAQLHAGGIDAGRRAVARPTGRRSRPRPGKLESPSRTDDLVERHAHHLGRGLRDDRVAAGADVGHVGLDRDDAAAVEPHARRRLRDQVVAEGGGDAHADQPAPVAHLARLRALRLLQPKRSAPVRRHSTSWRCENGGSPAFGGLGSSTAGCRHLRVVEDAELDRIEAELLRHLVHRDLERHHARRLAGRAHGVALGQVEHGQPRRGHAVGAGIEQARLLDRGLRLAAGQVAGPALVADRGDLAVAASRRCGCAGSSPADAWCC